MIRSVGYPVAHVLNRSRCFAIVLSLQLCGCDVQVRPPGTNAGSGPTSSLPNHQHDNPQAELDYHLASLQRELASVDATMSAEVAALRREVETKADKEEVRTLVQKELAKMQIRERLGSITSRTEGLEKRLDTLEENFGILPRVREAPWVESPKQQKAPKVD